MSKAVIERIIRERLAIARAEVAIAHKIEPGLGGRREYERIEMNVLAARLPLADNRDFFVDNVVGRQRVGRDEQNEDVAVSQSALDLRVPGVAAAHEAVDPDFDRSLLERGPEIAGHKRQPFGLVAARILRLVRMGVADEDARLVRL